MDKVAYFKGKEIAREKSAEPIKNEKFNVTELSEFFHRIGRLITYDNSEKVEFLVRFIN
jgi:hypothetical protein